LRALTIVTPAADFTPQSVQPGRSDPIVATVVSFKSRVLIVRVDAGRVRRLTFTLAEDAVVSVDAARLDLVAPGDAIEVKGRLWSGEGTAGAGTIFASHVTVTKRPPARPETREVAAGAGAAPGRAVE
jgi:phage gp45-like